MNASVAKRIFHPGVRVAVATVCFVVLSIAVVFLSSKPPASRPAEAHDLFPSLTPWASIGGCGAGGSGGAASTIKWIGKGVTGGLVDVQLLENVILARDYRHQVLTPRFSFRPTYTSQLALTLPILSKLNAVQPTTVQPRSYEFTGGTGDLSVDGSMNFGLSGQYSLQLSLTLPTGQYDVIRGSDATSYILPSGAQPGSGLTVPSFLLSYTKDIDDGIWVFDVSYSHPVVFSVAGKNEFLSTRYKAFADSVQNRRFYYHFKPYGENDLGDYMPPSVSATAYFGYEGIKGIMQSAGLSFSFPLQVAWVHEEKMNGDQIAYDPRPDPDHKAWNMQLSYGVELSEWYSFDNGEKKFPLFLAVAKPVHGKKNRYGKWHGPDWQAFYNEWNFYVGLKATMF